MNQNSKDIVSHEFIAIDEGFGNLIYVNENIPAQNWIVPIGHPQARDMQLIGKNRVLLSHHNGYTEFDIETGGVVKEFKALQGVTAARRQSNGNTIVAGVNIANTRGVVVLELNGDDAIIHRSVFPGDYVRLIRQTPAGTYLMSCNDRIREGSRDGKYLREFQMEGFYHAWKAVQLANGNVIVSAGYGAFMAEFDSSGGVLRKFCTKKSVPSEVNPFFYAMFQLLPNGHIVLANWQGHGPGLGSSGIQLLEFDCFGTIVWRWHNAGLISSLQGVLVLDGLDKMKLHDEQHGVMQPI